MFLRSAPLLSEVRATRAAHAEVGKLPHTSLQSCTQACKPDPRRAIVWYVGVMNVNVFMNHTLNYTVRTRSLSAVATQTRRSDASAHTSSIAGLTLFCRALAGCRYLRELWAPHVPSSHSHRAGRAVQREGHL